ncbi:unnamed protein product [Phytophthora fragariaefolia]|uniref:Unnamed protein product n=1 Tax=Phytophthora fragariaefolia TaxID=1490495 RepID=A0A9W6U2P2_9STRA|nr:unnamed protein product [Phytophthora fragariaefolia]
MSGKEEEAGNTAVPEPIVSRIVDIAADVAQQVNDFPQDASDEDFTKFLRGHHSKRLRAVCTQLDLHPQADPSLNHKDGYIELLSQYRRARLRGEVFSGHRTRSKKRPASVELGARTKHCGFRLANVLFSPTFFPRMAESGALPSTGLQVDVVDGRAKFWREVAAAYASENPEFDMVVGQCGRYEGIQPQLAPRHSPAQLCSIWKETVMRYEESLARWKQLGTESAGFTHFCGDFLDGLYLHDWLQIRPIPVDPDQLRASKRARNDNNQQGGVNAVADGNERSERQNFLTPHQKEETAQSRPSNSDGIQECVEQGFIVRPNAAQTPTQYQPLSASKQRRVLQRVESSQTAEQSQSEQAQAQQAPQRQDPLDIIDAHGGRRYRNKYEGVIYSSQALRETMSAIEALKRGRFDSAVIAQAEESMDAIIQVWLRELDTAGRPD